MERAGRAWYRICLTLGRVLRAARYAEARVVWRDGEREVRKQRQVHAPVLVWASGLLVRMLGTGVRVLPQRQWEERERQLYRGLYDASVRVNPGGVLVLPCLPGRTLASLLDDPALAKPLGKPAIELAAVALARFHAHGFTHGDAMAENVMVDVEGGVARWFDFETVHDAGRAMPWRRADDVRALLSTCIMRRAPAERADTLHVILDACADDEVVRLLAANFGSPWQRPLPFHLGQAALCHDEYGEIGLLLRERDGERAAGKLRVGGARHLHYTGMHPLERLP